MAFVLYNECSSDNNTNTGDMNMKNESGSEDNQTIRAEKFMKMIDVSPNTFKKLLIEGKLPEPLPLGTRNRRWSRSVVMDFLNNPGKYNTQHNTKI
jgi:predicted DNA-binding transcriptional regulator AlpA